MPSTDPPTTNDILISFDPLINEDAAIISGPVNEAGGTDALSTDRVSVILENGSLTRLAMSDLHSLPNSQRYCHVDDAFYILPNYTINRPAESPTDATACPPALERASFMSRLRTKFRSSSNASNPPKQSFGVSLDSLSPFPPPFLSAAFTCILQYPIEGVYRLSAAASAVTKATNMLNTNPSDTTFLNMVDELQSPILAAALIKSFIRQIPGGLLSCHHTILADAVNALTEHSNENKLLTLLHSLPHRNAIIARQLFDHLNTLLAFSESTKMTGANLATCMGPNLFSGFDIQEQNGGRDRKNSMDIAMMMTQLGTSLAKWLICDAHRIFDQLPTTHHIAVLLREDDRVEWIGYGDAMAGEGVEGVAYVQQFPLFTKPSSKLTNGGMNAMEGSYMNDLIEIDPFADSSQPIERSEGGEEYCGTADDQDGSEKDSLRLDPIEEQESSEVESNPWEEDLVIPVRSHSLHNLHEPSPEHESVIDTTTVMSEPGRASSSEGSPEL